MSAMIRYLSPSVTVFKGFAARRMASSVSTSSTLAIPSVWNVAKISLSYSSAVDFSLRSDNPWVDGSGIFAFRNSSGFPSARIRLTVPYVYAHW